MPGFDRTGPRGQGPMTGGGRGRCAPMTRDTGFGRGMGRGPGRELRRGFGGNFDSYDTSEINDLKAQVASMGAMIASLTQKVGDLIDKKKT